MKTSVNFSDFVEAFRRYDRYDQFGHDALKIIFDYLEEYENDAGKEMELDVIAICCDYSVDSPEDIAQNYSIAIAQNYSIDIEDLDEDELEDAVEEFLNDNTIILGKCEDGFVYCSAF